LANSQSALSRAHMLTEILQAMQNSPDRLFLCCNNSFPFEGLLPFEKIPIALKSVQLLMSYRGSTPFNEDSLRVRSVNSVSEAILQSQLVLVSKAHLNQALAQFFL